MKMLGRKQSLKGEPVLADYGPEESLNESADIEWVNKVRICNAIYFLSLEKHHILGLQHKFKKLFVQKYCQKQNTDFLLNLL